MRLVDYIREVADTSRKARAAAPGAGGSADAEGQVESPEVMLEKVRRCVTSYMQCIEMTLIVCTCTSTWCVQVP